MLPSFILATALDLLRRFAAAATASSMPFKDSASDDGVLVGLLGIVRGVFAYFFVLLLTDLLFRLLSEPFPPNLCLLRAVLDLAGVPLRSSRSSSSELPMWT